MERHSAFKLKGQPTYSVAGEGKQLIVLDLLQRYDLLPSPVLRKAVGDEKYGEEVLTKLCKGHYIGLPAELLPPNPPQRNRAYPYKLYDRGKALLEREGLWLERPQGNDHFAHKILRSQAQYAFDHPEVIGVKLITEDAILNDDSCPPETRDLAHPSYFNIRQYEVQPDGPILGYEYKGKRIYFHGFEADNGNEPIRENKKDPYKRVTIQQKFRHYTQYLEERMHRVLYGIPRVYIPFVLKPGLEARLLSMINLLREKYPQHAERFLFTTFTPDLVNAKWNTTQGEFNIIDKLEGR
jgi:hypothetical protein